MNKKIISFFTSVIIALCNVSLCMAEDSENIVYDTNQQLKKFSSSYATAKISDDVLECVISDAERSCVRVSQKFELNAYDNVNIRMKYEDINSPSSKALEYNGDTVPALRLGLKVIDETNTMSNKFIDIFSEELVSSDGYSTDDYVMFYGNLSDLAGYDTEKNTVYSISVYPAYGFSEGRAYIDMIEFEKASDSAVENEIPLPSDNEEWVCYEFDTDNCGWSTINGAKITVEDGIMKYVSTFNEKNQSGWIQKGVTFAGQQYFRVDIRAKVDGIALTPSGAIPYLTMYYSGVGTDGVSVSHSDSRKVELSYNCEKGDDGLYYSDWVEYSIDLSKLKSWDVMKSVSQLRFDLIKNAEGKIDIDYIRLFSMPAINEVGYNSQTGMDMQKVPVDIKTLDVYLSQPLYAVTAEDVKVYSIDGVEAELENVVYNKDKGIVTINLKEELLSMTDYCVEITKDALAGSTLKLYKELVYPFKTERSKLEVNVKKSNRSSVTMSVTNSDTKQRKILFIVTGWSGNEYADKVVTEFISEPTAEPTEIPISIKSLKGENVEVTAWEFVDGKPVTLGKTVYKFNK